MRESRHGDLVRWRPGIEQSHGTSADPVGIFARVAYARQPVMRLLRAVLGLVVVALGVTYMRLSIQTLASPWVYIKDFLQEYLLAQAYLSGLDPYAPLSVIATQIGLEVPVPIFPHPTPHPPPVLLLSLPFAGLPYETAARLWFGLSLGAVVFVASRFVRHVGRPTLIPIGFCVSLMLAWWPFVEELNYGQLMIMSLVCLVCSWESLSNGRDLRAGVLIGLVIAFKLVAWPVAIFLLLRKRRQAFLSAVATAGALNLSAASLMGLDTVWHYYTQVGPSVASHYRSVACNFSLWTVAWRLFDGTKSSIIQLFNAPPLVEAPGVIPYVGILLVGGVLTLALISSMRVRSFDTGFGIVVCVSVLVSPVAWIHYFTWLTIPLLIVLRRLLGAGLPTRLTTVFGVNVLLLSPNMPSLFGTICRIAGYDSVSVDVCSTVPFAVGGLSYMMTLAVVLLGYLLWSSDCYLGADASEDP